MKKYITIAAIAIIFVLMCVLSYQSRRIGTLEQERERYKTNSEILAGKVDYYRTSDSLNAASVQTLRLTVAEYVKFRAEDAALIKSLQTKNRALKSAISAQTSTVVEVVTQVHDTVVVVDSLPTSAKSLKCGDEWYTFEGLLTGNEFTGTMQTRDYILVAESIQYKRFLGFLWKTKRIKNRKIDIVSKNPHCKVVDVEHTIFDNFNY